MTRIVGVRFKKACKIYDFDASDLDLNPYDVVIVEVDRGLGLGSVVGTPREVDPETLTRPLKKVVRKADAVDLERNGFNTERENEAFRICKEKIVQYKLPMKLIRVEYLFDSSKAIFYFTSETRVDFRELVKDLAAWLHTRIEMRQIGVRDEAKMIGGLGPCGRELCCAGFLADFEPVTIKMAKEQNLALNPVKISGICGRLMCCLSYEHEMYQGERPARKGEGCGGCGGHGEAESVTGEGLETSAAENLEKAERPERQERRERPRPDRKERQPERGERDEKKASGERPEKKDRRRNDRRQGRDRQEKKADGERRDRPERPERPPRGERERRAEGARPQGEARPERKTEETRPAEADTPKSEEGN